MRKSKFNKKRAAMILAAVMGTAGVTGSAMANVWAYTVAQGSDDGIAVYTDTEPAESSASEISEDVLESNKETGQSAESSGSFAQESTAVVNSEEAADGTAVQEDALGHGLDDFTFWFEAMGLKWDDDNNIWRWDGKMVEAIWLGDQNLIFYGGISDSKEETVCLHITAEKGEGTAAFKLQEMTKAELKEAYRESGNGYWE